MIQRLHDRQPWRDRLAHRPDRAPDGDRDRRCLLRAGPQRAFTSTPSTWRRARRRDARRVVPPRRRDHCRRPRVRLRCGASGLRLPRRERRVRDRGDQRRADVGRPDRRNRSRLLGDKVAAKRLAIDAGVPTTPIVERHGRPRPHVTALPAARQGRRRRGRARHARRSRSPPTSIGAIEPRRGRRCRRSVTARCSSSRTSSAGVTSRSRSWATRTARRPLRRTRVLDPASQPEGDRGSAIAGNQRRRPRPTPCRGIGAGTAVGYQNAGTVEFMIGDADEGAP